MCCKPGSIVIDVNLFALELSNHLIQASQKFKDICQCDLTAKLLIISSDFKRTRETAETLHQCLHPIAPVRLDPRLRERNFGSLNGSHSSNYQRVWDEDAKSTTHTSCGCESVSSVFRRTLELVDDIESENEGKIIVLVSHGDTSQITITGYRGLSPHEHRDLPHLDNCHFVELAQS